MMAFSPRFTPIYSHARQSDLASVGTSRSSTPSSSGPEKEKKKMKPLPEWIMGILTIAIAVLVFLVVVQAILISKTPTPYLVSWRDLIGSMAPWTWISLLFCLFLVALWQVYNHEEEEKAKVGGVGERKRG
jgi:polyferredoxin